MAVQVQSATKNRQGESLSVLNRQFISFKYGEKNIEDFNLLAVFNGDRLKKEIYASFDDITSNSSELDGQLFWKSKFNAGKLTFNLATDGMTVQDLENFKEWFKPGLEKELILSENHNRAILARVESAPEMSLLPFENQVKVLVGNEEYTTTSSLYKGEIVLNFVMDDPYWYSLVSNIEVLNSENIKIIYEDGIPHPSMLSVNCFLANKEYCSLNNEIINQKLTLKKETDEYLYYCGTAPAFPIISFEVIPYYGENNKISFLENEENFKYFLKFENSFSSEQESKSLIFTLPSLFSSYNKVLDIVSKYTEKKSILDLRREIRDYIYNYYTRSYAIAIIDKARKDEEHSHVEVTGEVKSTFISFFIEEMKKFFPNKIGEEDNRLKCVINCKNGEVIIEGNINIFDTEEYQFISENAGKMIKSNYLTIEKRKLSTDGIITKENCFKISTNINLYDLEIDYKYMYL